MRPESVTRMPITTNRASSYRSEPKMRLKIGVDRVISLTMTAKRCLPSDYRAVGILILADTRRPRASSSSSSAGLEGGFSRLDLSALVLVLALLGVVGLPAVSTGDWRVRQAVCVNNLSRIGQALDAWATDHQGLYPFQVRPADGGTMGLSDGGLPHYSILANHLVATRLLVCPSDPAIIVAPSFSTLRNTSVSYFLSHPFVSQGRAILAGDKNLPYTNSFSSCPYLGSTLTLALPMEEGVGWDGRIHGYAGNLLFNDGSVEQKDNAGLRARVVAGLDGGASFHYLPP